jgi:hypothetical protein
VNQGAQPTGSTISHETSDEVIAAVCQLFSTIRTITVGFGFTPNLLTFPPLLIKAGKRSRAFIKMITAGGDFHPALRTLAFRPLQKGRHGVNRNNSF